MQIKDKKFIPNEGLGLLRFDLNEKELTDMLVPNRIRYKKEARENVIEYLIGDDIDNISVFFHYENSCISYLSIHTSDLILDNVSIGKMSSYEELMEVIKEFHNKNNVEFRYTISDELDELFIDFKNIGLSVWFEDEKISDICIMAIGC